MEREKIKDLLYDIVQEWNESLYEDESFTETECDKMSNYLESYYDKVCLCIDDLYIDEQIKEVCEKVVEQDV